jgi:predicted PurR-regulated permease PerM
MMTRLLALLLFLLLALGGGLPALANICPLLIQRAEELIKKAERGKPSPEARALLEEARKLVGEARASHEGVKGKPDHADAIRKAKTAQALAEEAAGLAGQ